MNLSTTRLFSSRSWLWAFPVFLLVLSTGVFGGEIDHCIEEYPQAPELSDAAARLMDALSTPPPAPDERAAALRHGLEQLERNGSTAERRVLGNRARLILGALALQQGELAHARTWLEEIELESFAGTTAGLLRAEIALAAGRPGQARQWYLRIGKQFAFHPQALEGLVRTADMLAGEKDDETALSLYETVIQRADRAASRLQAASDLFDAQGIRVLVEPHDELEPALQRELVRIGLGLEDDMLHAGVAAPRARRQHQCLLERHRALQQELRELNARQQELILARDQLERRMAGHRQRLTKLEARVVPGDTSQEQNRIRRDVRQLRNALHRKDARLSFLGRNSERITALRTHVETRFLNLLASVSLRAERTGKTLEKSFETAIDQNSAELQQVAAAAWHGRARVLERQSGLPGR